MKADIDKKKSLKYEILAILTLVFFYYLNDVVLSN